MNIYKGNRAIKANLLTIIDKPWGYQEGKEYVAFKYGDGQYLLTWMQNKMPRSRVTAVNDLNREELIDKYQERMGNTGKTDSGKAYGEFNRDTDRYIEFIQNELIRRLDNIDERLDSLNVRMDEEWEAYGEQEEETSFGGSDGIMDMMKNFSGLQGMFNGGNKATPAAPPPQPPTTNNNPGDAFSGIMSEFTEWKNQK